MNRKSKLNLTRCILLLIFLPALITSQPTENPTPTSTPEKRTCGTRKDKPPTKTYYSINVDALEDLAWQDLSIAKIFRGIQDFDFPAQEKLKVKKYVRDVEGGLVTSKKDPTSKDSRLRPTFTSWSNPWLRQKAREVSNNPIAAFRLLYRVTKDLPKLVEILEVLEPKSNNQPSLKFSEIKRLLPKNMPDDSDYRRAMAGLFRLVSKRQLAPMSVASGAIFGVPLDAHHCHELGSLTRGQGQGVKKAGSEIRLWNLQWLALALIKEIESNGGSSKLSQYRKDEIRKFELELLKKIEKLLRSKLGTKLEEDGKTRIFFNDLQHGAEAIQKKRVLPGDTLEKIISACYHIHQLLKEEAHLKNPVIKALLAGKFKFTSKHNLTLHENLCAGRNLLTDTEKSRLFCWLESRASFFYTIGPMKLEFISRNPDIVQIYDVIGQKGIRRIAKATREKFRRRVVLGNDNEIDSEVKIVANDLVGKNCVERDYYSNNFGTVEVTEENPPEIQNLAPILRHSLHLFGFEAHDLKLATFSYAGQKMPNFGLPADDFGPKDKPQSLSYGRSVRLATFQVFLGDEPYGGETTFPLSRVKADVIQGSAVMWFNVLTNGKIDTGVMHGDCPVFKGRKFTMTQFASLDDAKLNKQFCPSNQKPRFQIPVNGRMLPNKF